MFGHRKFRSNFPESSSITTPSRREKAAGARRPGASVPVPVPRQPQEGHRAAPGYQPVSPMSPLHSLTPAFPGVPAGGPGRRGQRSQCRGTLSARGAGLCLWRTAPGHAPLGVGPVGRFTRVPGEPEKFRRRRKNASWGGIIFPPPCMCFPTLCARRCPLHHRPHPTRHQHPLARRRGRGPGAALASPGKRRRHPARPRGARARLGPLRPGGTAAPAGGALVTGTAAAPSAGTAGPRPLTDSGAHSALGVGGN